MILTFVGGAERCVFVFLKFRGAVLQFPREKSGYSQPNNSGRCGKKRNRSGPFSQNSKLPLDSCQTSVPDPEERGGMLKFWGRSDESQPLTVKHDGGLYC